MESSKNNSNDNFKSVSKFFSEKSNSDGASDGGSSKIRRLPYHYHRSSVPSSRERPASLDHIYPEYTSLAKSGSLNGAENSEVRRINSTTNWYGNFPQSDDILEPKSEIDRHPFSTSWFANYPQVPEYSGRSEISLESALDSKILENSSEIERIPSTTSWYGNFPQTWDPESQVSDMTFSEQWKPKRRVGSTDFFVPSRVFSGPQVFEGPVEFRGPVRFMGPIYIGNSSIDISQSLQRMSRQ